MLNYVPRLMLLALVASLLISCGMASFNSACPPIKKYDREFQRKLANEVNNAPVEAAFPTALQDYAVLRAEIKACQP